MDHGTVRERHKGVVEAETSTSVTGDTTLISELYLLLSVDQCVTASTLASQRFTTNIARKRCLLSCHF